jgi:hypothetical protein
MAPASPLLAPSLFTLVSLFVWLMAGADLF